MKAPLLLKLFTSIKSLPGLLKLGSLMNVKKIRITLSTIDANGNSNSVFESDYNMKDAEQFVKEVEFNDKVLKAYLKHQR